MTIKNQRSEARLEARIPVVIVRGRRIVPLVTNDVSFRGVFILTSEPLALRSLVRMRVLLPDHEIEVHGMVVHILPPGDGRDAGVGLQFWGLAGPARVSWEDFVRALIQERREAASSLSPPADSTPNIESSGIHFGIRPPYGRASSN